MHDFSIPPNKHMLQIANINCNAWTAVLQRELLRRKSARLNMHKQTSNLYHTEKNFNFANLNQRRTPQPNCEAMWNLLIPSQETHPKLIASQITNTYRKSKTRRTSYTPLLETARFYCLFVGKNMLFLSLFKYQLQ